MSATAACTRSAGPHWLFGVVATYILEMRASIMPKAAGETSVVSFCRHILPTAGRAHTAGRVQVYNQNA